MDHHSIYQEISRIYRSIDRKTLRLQQAASLQCQDGCGACCQTHQIEATILETLPLAESIFNNGEEETVLTRVEEKLSLEDFSCALFQPDINRSGDGYCTYYSVRPLLCRLFGFAARRNRHGELEFSSCERITGNDPHGVRRAQLGVSSGLRVPVYQESFMRIATMNPSIGFQNLPINIAIKEAIEYLYWRRPGKAKMAKAS